LIGGCAATRRRNGVNRGRQKYQSSACAPDCAGAKRRRYRTAYVRACWSSIFPLVTFLVLGLATISGAASPPGIAEFPAGLDPNQLLMPPPSSDGLVRVNVALHVLNLSDINEVTERFRLTGYLLAQWHDSRLAYQPSGPADRFRTLKPDSVWQPKLVIINVAAPRQVFERSLRVEPEGTVSYVERFDALVSSTFHLKSFPFDSQKLEILVHPFTNQQQFVIFTPSKLPVWAAAEFASYSSLDSWNFQSLTFRLSKAGSQLGSNAVSEARFDITVVRRYGFYLWKVFLPLLLMVIVSWSVFWFDPPEVSSQVQIAVTTILTIIAFALAISLTLPRISYLTFADAFFLTCYIFAFVSMLELTAVHIAYRNESRALALKLRRTARWLVPTAYLITNTFLILHFLA
jgi:Neurotransmitter-gated ion-channel ligand binding domain/Neurotransmitter-gated ion-channel transmembrane region